MSQFFSSRSLWPDKACTRSDSFVVDAEKPTEKVSEKVSEVKRRKPVISVLDSVDGEVVPKQDESPPESVVSSYRTSQRGMKGMLGSLWPAATPVDQGMAPFLWGEGRKTEREKK